jgi:hypothetical protein
LFIRLACPVNLAILSVGESWRRLQLPVRDYFSTILPELAGLPTRCLPDLTPTGVGWAAFMNPSDEGVE